jgi:hypothetical protein
LVGAAFAFWRLAGGLSVGGRKTQKEKKLAGKQTAQKRCALINEQFEIVVEFLVTFAFAFAARTLLL